VLLRDLPWKGGYVIVAAAQLALAVCFAATVRSWPASGPAREDGAARALLLDTAKVRTVRISMLVFFLYVGLEASAGAWICSLLYESRGFGMSSAGLAVSIYWGGLLAGRVACALLPWRYVPTNVVTCCIAMASIAMSVAALDQDDYATLAAIAILGMASGPIFPLLIATTPERVGAAHAANAIGMQVGVSALGVAVFPAVAGILADSQGLAALPVGLVGLWVTLLGAHMCLVRAAALERVRPRP
jgi:fucose permease